MTNEYRLLRDLFENYDKEVRPVFNKTDVVNVNFSMSLIQIVNVVSRWCIGRLELTTLS